jgi:hypothetical protein
MGASTPLASSNPCYNFRMKIPRKAKIILGVVAVLGLVAAWQYVSYLFKYGYSRGSRTGIVRKVSVKGPPYCKYVEGELALQGATVAQNQDIFTFSVDENDEKSPLIQKLKKAQQDGTRVTVDYRYDKAAQIWWRCNPSEWFITNVQ